MAVRDEPLPGGRGLGGDDGRSGGSQGTAWFGDPALHRKGEPADGGGRAEGSGRKGARRGGHRRRILRHLAARSRKESRNFAGFIRILPQIAARVQGQIGGGRGEKEAG